MSILTLPTRSRAPLIGSLYVHEILFQENKEVDNVSYEAYVAIYKVIISL